MPDEVSIAGGRARHAEPDDPDQVAVAVIPDNALLAKSTVHHANAVLVSQDRHAVGLETDVVLIGPEGRQHLPPSFDDFGVTGAP
jgi:hypothetical protein